MHHQRRMETTLLPLPQGKPCGGFPAKTQAKLCRNCAVLNKNNCVLCLGVVAARTNAVLCKECAGASLLSAWAGLECLRWSPDTGSCLQFRRIIAFCAEAISTHSMSVLSLRPCVVNMRRLVLFSNLICVLAVLWLLICVLIVLWLPLTLVLNRGATTQNAPKSCLWKSDYKKSENVFASLLGSRTCLKQNECRMESALTSHLLITELMIIQH